MWILLFSEVTVFGHYVSTILSPIADIPITKCHETVILLNSFVRIFQKKMNDITRVMSKTEE